MKIVKIEPHSSIPVCDMLLSIRYYSDALFDMWFIDVTVDIEDNPMAPLYRKLWEDIYFKISGSVTRFNDQNQLVVGITVSEALGFIYKATPPRFQKNIEEYHKSINDIIKSLNTFLTGDESYIAFSDMFFEYTHLKKFDTKWQNFDRIRSGADVVKSNLSRGVAYGAYIYASTVSVDTLVNDASNPQMGASTTMMCVKLDLTYPATIRDFCKNFLFGDGDLGKYDESFLVKVDNIHIEGPDAYVGIMVDVNPARGGGSWTYFPKPWCRLMHNSYANLK